MQSFSRVILVFRHRKKVNLSQYLRKLCNEPEIHQLALYVSRYISFSKKSSVTFTV